MHMVLILVDVAWEIYYVTLLLLTKHQIEQEALKLHFLFPLLCFRASNAQVTQSTTHIHNIINAREKLFKPISN